MPKDSTRLFNQRWARELFRDMFLAQGSEPVDCSADDFLTNYAAFPKYADATAAIVETIGELSDAQICWAFFGALLDLRILRLPGPQTMTLYTIYNKPKDYPNNVAIRDFVMRGGTVSPYSNDPYAICSSIEEARAMIPEHLTVIPRDPNDTPDIVETWL